MLLTVNGHVKTQGISGESLNVYGLNSNFRARFMIPMKRAVSGIQTAVLKAPGFGQTSIVDIVSDKPFTQATDIIGIEDSNVDAFFAGSSYKNLIPVVGELSVAPTNGKLYQYSAGGVGSEIKVGDYVLDATNRAIYIPSVNKYSVPVGTVFDSFSYIVTDGCAPSQSATVRIYIKPQPDAPSADSLTLTTYEDTPLNFTITYADPDFENDNQTSVAQYLQYQLLSNPQQSVLLNSAPVAVNSFSALSTARSQKLRYSPVSNWNGNYQFTFQVKDSTFLTSNTAVVNINVLPVNDAPGGSASSPVVGFEDTVLPVTLNGWDVDSSAITFKVLLPATFTGALYPSVASNTPIVNGTVLSLSPAGPQGSVTVYYRPVADAYSCNGNDVPYTNCNPTSSFSFVVLDNEATVQPFNLATSPINVDLFVYNVDDAPVASDIVITLYEDSTAFGQLNATDIDNSQSDLSYVITGLPDSDVALAQSNGVSVTVVNTQVTDVAHKVQVTPAANVFGDANNDYLLDIATYQVNDLDLSSNTANIKIRVLPVNDPPAGNVANPVIAYEDVLTPVTLNGWDIDSSNISFRVVLPANFTGSLYVANSTSSAKIVNNQVLLPVNVTSTGTVTVWFLGQPNAYSCSETDYVFSLTNKSCNAYSNFQFQVLDNEKQVTPYNLESSAIDVAVFVFNVDDAPTVPEDIDVTIYEDQVATFTLTASDIDTPQNQLGFYIGSLPSDLTFTQFNGSALVANGLITDASRRFKAAPGADLFGDANNNYLYDTFYYQVYDGKLFSNSGTLRLFVLPVNDAPDGSVTNPVVGNEDTLIPVTLNGWDIDSAAITFRFTIPAELSGALYATSESETPLATGDVVALSPSGPQGSIVVYYKPAANAYSCNGNDSPYSDCEPLSTFQFEVLDNEKLVQPYDLKSSLISVDLFVYNVDDAPVAKNVDITLVEDSSAFVQLNATDIDNAQSDLTYVLFDLPEDITLEQFSGDVITALTKQVTDAAHRINVVPDSNVFGDPNNGFLLDITTFQVSDLELDSNTANVRIFVTPVNDAPVPTLDHVTTAENTPVVVTLTATDIDTPADGLTFTVSAIPASLGSLHLYDSDATNYVGALITDATLVTKVDGDALVVFVPKADLWGSTSFEYTVEDVDVYGLTPSFKVPKTVSVVVTPVNHEPTAAIPSPVGYENEALVITLSGYDYTNENDQLQAEITKPLYSGGDCDLTGDLYQYNEELGSDAEAYATSGTKITEANTLVTDSQNRVVYVPPTYKNTDQVLKTFTLIKPYFAFRVTEVTKHAEPGYLKSTSNDIAITVKQVNQHPVVWNDAWVQDHGVEACYSDCVFQEDLGYEWRHTVNPVAIYFGGNDVEKGTLGFVVTAVDCPVGASLQTLGNSELPRGNGLNYALSTSVDLTAPSTCDYDVDSDIGSLVQALTFVPELDANNNADGYYCKVTYKVVDEDGALSDDSKTVTIGINSINDEPRPKVGLLEVFVLENYHKDLVLKGTDPEDDQVQLVLLSCTEGQGSFSIVDGTTVTPIFCNYTSDYVVSPASFTLRFTPNVNEYGYDYSTLEYTFLDNVSPATKDVYTVKYHVVPANSPPVISVGGSILEEHTSVNFVVKADSAHPKPVIADANLDDTSLGLVTVTLEIESAAALHIDLSGVEVENNTGSFVVFSGVITAVNKALDSLAVYTEVEGSYNLHITVSDNGNSGGCLDANEDILFSCVLASKTAIPYNAVLQSGSLNTFALGGAAAGALIITGLIGAGVGKRMVKHAPEYKPWMIGQEPENGVIDNPLYEGSAPTDNPLYDPDA